MIRSQIYSLALLQMLGVPHLCVLSEITQSTQARQRCLTLINFSWTPYASGAKPIKSPQVSPQTPPHQTLSPPLSLTPQFQFRLGLQFQLQLRQRRTRAPDEDSQASTSHPSRHLVPQRLLTTTTNICEHRYERLWCSKNPRP